MLGYTLLGAVIGAVIGHLIPPGYFFWFAVGAFCGYLVQRCGNHRF